MTTKIIPIRRVSSLLIPTNNTSMFSYRKLRGQQDGRRELLFLLNCACWLTIAVRLHSNAWKCRSIPFVCWCINPETITRSFRKLCGDFYKVGRKPKSIFYSHRFQPRTIKPTDERVWTFRHNQTYRREGWAFRLISLIPHIWAPPGAVFCIFGLLGRQPDGPDWQNVMKMMTTHT